MPVSPPSLPSTTSHKHDVNDWKKGSGCIAALEAEKYLAELDDTPVANGIEAETEAKKPSTADAPEYRSNPLL